VIAAIFERDGLDPRSSDAGTVAERLIEQLGGLQETALLRHRELLKVLDKAAVTGVAVETTDDDTRLRAKVSFIKHAEMVRVLAEAVGQRSVSAILGQLVDRSVVRLGLTLRCEACGYINWLELDAVRRSLLCERCLTGYEFPQATPPDRGSWAYRPTGACGVENFARGSYTVAHALRFFDSALEPMIWCTGTRLGKRLEVDFALMRKQHDAMPRLLLGEAKTMGRFKREDFRRAARVLRRFPDATFAFATLRDRLTRDERAAVRALARPRVQRLRDLPYQPRIVVLTALELCSVGGPPSCWREAGGRTAEVAAEAELYVRDDVDVWADITLQLHVGLGRHAEWWERQTRRVVPRPGRTRPPRAP
jgi:hypothetical protein